MAKVNRRCCQRAATRSGERGAQSSFALNANTGQVHAALMTHQDMADGDALWPSCSIRFRATHRSISSSTTVPTTPSHTMRPLQHAVLFLQFLHALVPLIGQRICPVRRGVTVRLMQLSVKVVEDGRKAVATTSDRLPRMRGIGSGSRLTGNYLWWVSRRNQPHGGTRSSAIRSCCLKLCPSMPLHPHA
ncbi:MAG: hypothetical protein E5299_01182 [Burkholderia gladioli]|nr:MAG: hypothetical protein E5299_01182 [Burkholderia gladioli]